NLKNRLNDDLVKHVNAERDVPEKNKNWVFDANQRLRVIRHVDDYHAQTDSMEEIIVCRLIPVRDDQIDCYCIKHQLKARMKCVLKVSGHGWGVLLDGEERKALNNNDPEKHGQVVRLPHAADAPAVKLLYRYRAGHFVLFQQHI